MRGKIDDFDVFAISLHTKISIEEISKALNVPCPSDLNLKELIDPNLTFEGMCEIYKSLSSKGRIKKIISMRKIILRRINEVYCKELKKSNITLAQVKEIATCSFSNNQTKTEAIIRMAQFFKEFDE